MENSSGMRTNTVNHMEVIRAHCPKRLCNPCDSIPKQDVQSVVFEFDDAWAYFIDCFWIFIPGS